MLFPVSTTRAGLKPVAAKQRVVFVHRPLTGLAAEDHHRDVEQGDPDVRLARHGDHLDDEQPVTGSHPFAAPHAESSGTPRPASREAPG